MATKKEILTEIETLDPETDASDAMKHEELSDILAELKDRAGKDSFEYKGDVVSGFDLEDGTGVTLSPGSVLKLPKNDKKVLNMIAKKLLVPVENKN